MPFDDYFMLRNTASGRAFRAGYNRTATGKTPKSVGRRPAARVISVFSRWQSGQNPARMAALRPGNEIA